MREAGKFPMLLLSVVLTVAGCNAPSARCDHEISLPPTALGDWSTLLPPATPATAIIPELPSVPPPVPGDRPLPINLPSALQLANVRAVDIAAATERIQAAAAALEQAQVLWFPSITLGGDYYRHDGPIQDVSNAIFNNSHSWLMLGAGSGIGPAAVLTVDDAIFAPLVAKQQVKAREADRLTAANDTLVAVTDAYFGVQQARGDLAAATETTRRIEELADRTRKLAPSIVPELELFRVETELAHRQDGELLAREHWKVASADLTRVLRLDPAAQVEPLESPHLRIELIDLHKSLDELIAVGLTYRPELASQQAQVQASIELLRQERWRPLLPNFLLRGASTNPGGTLAGGGFFPNPNGSEAGMRADVDLQILWQLDNLGFGNVAKVHQKQADNRAAALELLRLEDRIASEVAQAYAQAQLAARRLEVAERGLKPALLSVSKNLEALSQTKGVGNQQVTLVRPQEVVAAIQALAQSYTDYYGAVADANRAQFRLYRALGQPAQYVEQGPSLCSPTILPPATLGRPTEAMPSETNHVEESSSAK
jgi:outer membrane protein TolC